jgi:ArsR family transcriptional regulator
VVAVDNSAAMLAAARRRLAGVDSVEMRRGDLEDLPVADAELDAAVLTLVLPYLPEPLQAIREVARALRPGGRVLVTDLLPHDREAYRQQLGHQWLGFSESQMTGWLAATGFIDLRFHALSPAPEAKGPGLFVATARRAVTAGQITAGQITAGH